MGFGYCLDSAWEAEHEAALSEQAKKSAARKLELTEGGRAAVDKFYAERKAMLEQRKSDHRCGSFSGRLYCF